MSMAYGPVACPQVRSLLDGRQTFAQLDQGAEGILKYGEGSVHRGGLAVGTIEFNSRVFELLRECLQAHHLQANPVERSSFGWRDRSFRLLEQNARPGNTGDSLLAVFHHL